MSGEPNQHAGAVSSWTTAGTDGWPEALLRSEHGVAPGTPEDRTESETLREGSVNPVQASHWQEVLWQFLRQLARRDPELRSHSERVCGVSLRIGRALGLSGERLFILFAAALLHDIGKLLIPAGILDKPGKLTLSEFRRVRDHAIHGEQMLKAASLPFSVCRSVRGHHERYDGKGYPDRLEGEEIPLEARILGVADAYDAMTADRPYHAGMGGRAACQRISRLAGVHFDPRVVESFLPLPAGGMDSSSPPEDRRSGLAAQSA